MTIHAVDEFNSEGAGLGGTNGKLTVATNTPVRCCNSVPGAGALGGTPGGG